jgi:hypothetical protein
MPITASTSQRRSRLRGAFVVEVVVVEVVVVEVVVGAVVEVVVEVATGSRVVVMGLLAV